MSRRRRRPGVVRPAPGARLSPSLHDSDASAARLALRCLDLTSLRDDDSTTSIEALAARADTPHGAPAALCVYPRFVPVARAALAARGLSGVRVATVVNFPHGNDAPGAVARAIGAALADGADEIDAVIPWQALRAGDDAAVAALLRAARTASRAAPLKVILETGELQDAALIRRAAVLAVDGGADFLKTSTGKVPVNATPEAAAVLLAVIAERGGQVGLKVAGGVATLADVQRYLALARDACGAAFLAPSTLRFGASSLLSVLLAAIDGGSATAIATAASGY